MRAKLPILICSFIVFLFCDCSKSRTSQVHPTFTFSGQQEVYCTVTFFSNTTDSMVNWIFSDGFTGTGKTLKRIFWNPGKYTVTMISGGDSSTPITEYVNITSGLERLSSLHWYKGREYVHDSNQYYNFAVNDTSFEINVVDDTTISIGAAHLLLHGQNFDYRNYTNNTNYIEIALRSTSDSFLFSYVYSTGDSIHGHELQYYSWK